MNTIVEKFWHKYLNESIFDIYDDACEFFSQELPKEFFDNYDAGEVLLEINGHHKTAKLFDKVIKFSKLLRDKQPELRKKYFHYINDFLIDYYCFSGEYDKAEDYFADFIENPVQDIDKYLMSYKKLLFYQQMAVLDEAIIKNYRQIAEDPNIMGATSELAYVKYYVTLEDFYKQAPEQNYDQEKLAEKLAKLKQYNFTLDKKQQTAIIAGMSEKMSKDEMVKAFINDGKSFNIIFELYFLRYMAKKNFPFALSEFIWSRILTFLTEENDGSPHLGPEVYFTVNAAKFEKFIASLSGSFFIDNTSEKIATLWGSVYVYDFLSSIAFIDDKLHQDFIKITQTLKGQIIAQSLSSLWNSNFIHLWEKPDSISDNEFIEERKIFVKSSSLKNQRFIQLRSQIAEELENIGELASHIIEPEEVNINPFARNNHNKPVTRKKKTGRNEPCPCGSGKKYKKCCG